MKKWEKRKEKDRASTTFSGIKQGNDKEDK